MTGISHGANMTIAKKFPWANYKSAVDVGTAQGDLITQVALANPHIAGIGFDLPASAPSSRTTSPPTASPAASTSAPAASSTHPSPTPTSS